MCIYTSADWREIGSRSAPCFMDDLAPLISVYLPGFNRGLLFNTRAKHE